MSGWTQVVKWLLESYRKENVPYCVLRGYESLPEVRGHDIDIMIHPNHWKKNLRVLNEMKEKFSLNLYKHIPMPYANRYYYKHAEIDKDLILDFHINEQWLGCVFFTADDVLTSRIDRGNAFSAHDVHAGISPFLVTFLSTGNADTKYNESLIKASQSDSYLFSEMFKQIMGKSTGNYCYSLIRAEDFKSLQKSLTVIRRAIIRKSLSKEPISTIGRLFKTLLYIIWYKKISKVYPP